MEPPATRGRAEGHPCGEFGGCQLVVVFREQTDGDVIDDVSRVAVLQGAYAWKNNVKKRHFIDIPPLALPAGPFYTPAVPLGAIGLRDLFTCHLVNRM